MNAELTPRQRALVEAYIYELFVFPTHNGQGANGMLVHNTDVENLRAAFEAMGHDCEYRGGYLIYNGIVIVPSSTVVPGGAVACRFREIEAVTAWS